MLKSLLLFLGLRLVAADLPVSCYQWDVIGEWEFTVGLYNGADCGYASPDRPGQHAHLTPGPPLESVYDKSKYGLTDAWQPEGRFRSFISQNHVHVMELSSPFADEDGRNVALDEATAKKYHLEEGAGGMWSMVYNQGFYMQMQGARPSAPMHHMYAVSQYVVTPGLDVLGNDVIGNRDSSQCGKGW